MEINEEIRLDNVRMVLDEYALKFQELIKRKIVEQDKVASGNLLASIHTEVNINGDVYTVYLHSEHYLKFIELGTKPHWPPPQPMIEWVKNKKLPTKESTGNKSLPTEKQLAYLVSRKISEVGTKPVPVIAETQEELNEAYIPRLQAALELDIYNALPIIQIQLRFI